jgi:hypothetical protein
VNLSVLRSIKERYKNFLEIVTTYRRTQVGTLSSEQVKFVKEIIEDLFIVEIFSCFERFLRDKINNCLSLEDCLFGHQQILRHIEYLKIEDLLDSLKNSSKLHIDSKDIGLIKQIKQYRDWVAHGRNPQKPPPIKTVDFDKVFEIIETIMEQMEKGDNLK